MLKLSKADSQILLDAISKDKIHLARFILDALDGKIIDCKSEGAQTPLISAVFLQDSHARCKFMSLLLQRGASVNHRDESGRTALSYACETGDLDAVKILVRNGADPEAADRWGNTALMYAVVARHSAVVEFLVRAFKRLGLQIDRQNKVGNSAVEVAKHLGHTECLQALVSNKRTCDAAEALAEELSTVTIRPPEDRPGLHSCRRTLSLRNRIQSMDSIKETERESDAAWAFSAQGLVTPKPPQKLSAEPHNHLPPLFYSPRPSKMPWRSCPHPSSSGPLGILLTPFSKSVREEAEKVGKAQFELPLLRFHESYYQKRCSLPTSVLAPERRKSRSAGSRSLSAFSSRLLRRFTFPEFKRSSREDAPDSPGSDPHGHCIPRSETFPLGKKHPQVGNKPSIDSISAVKCEFDLQSKAEPLTY